MSRASEPKFQAQLCASAENCQMDVTGGDKCANDSAVYVTSKHLMLSRVPFCTAHAAVMYAKFIAEVTEW